jgi:transposase
MENFRWYGGVDWGSKAHQTTITDAAGEVLEERLVAHCGAALQEWIERLEVICGGHPGEMAIAIEVPRGPVVEALLERGFAVFAINPKQLDRFRDRHNVAGAKDDRRDAYVLARSLRTDGDCFRRLRLDDPQTIRLRTLSRANDDLVESLGRESNRLRDELYRYFPQALDLCPAADEAWFWDLLELIPTPQAAQRVRPSAVTKLLARNRIRRVGAEEVLAKLRQPALYVAPGVVEAAQQHIVYLLAVLRTTAAQRRDCERRLGQLLEELGQPASGTEEVEHRDAAILLSLPGVGISVGAAMLSEAGQAIAERNYHTLRGQAGTAPVTEQTGRRPHGSPKAKGTVKVHMRHACSARLREATFHWARVSVQRDPRSRAHYAALKQRGHSHGRALRGVADRLLKLLVTMLKSGTRFDSARWNRIDAIPSGAA